MFVLIVVISVGPLGYLFATVWRVRHRDDPIREREQAFVALRHMVESPRVQVNELVEQVPVVSGHVRILSERPPGLLRPRRQHPAAARPDQHSAAAYVDDFTAEDRCRPDAAERHILSRTQRRYRGDEKPQDGAGHAPS